MSPTTDHSTTAPTRKDPVLAARAAIGLAVRHGNDPTPARHELTAAHLERAIDQALHAQYPLSDERRRALAARLLGGAK